MPNYRWEVRNAHGRIESGQIAADTASGAAMSLRQQGHHVLKLIPIVEQRVDWKRMVEVLSTGSGPSQKDVLDFTVQLAVMVRAGINLRMALDGIADQVKNARFRRIILQIRADVEAGKSFSEAISRYPKLFSPLYVNMVKASEMSGAFAKMLDRIAAFIAQQLETRKMVVGASIYPGVIATMAISVTVFLLTFVLPRFAGVFAGKEEVLPRPTKMLLALSDWMVNNWILLVVMAALAVIGLLATLKTSIGQLWFDRLKLIVPLFKRMFRALYVSRSLQTMGELLNAGVPVLDAVSVTGDISGNRLYKNLWKRVQSAVREGRKLHEELDGSPLLPGSVVQMVAAGEESGRLGEVLEEVAEFYQRALRDAIKTMTGMIEPILIVIMGSIVGFIAMAIILPIFKMSSLVSG
ncbi:MAG: type II secretion system F family protein [Phycisphaerales bacterium]|jgi:type IV pilus assembly protein PilC|nr:type II secretion system F family protein [Phycisphaerales bacterium]MDP6890584.1 type II secretion system F family protein [Phycisphaerales bacterium]